MPTNEHYYQPRLAIKGSLRFTRQIMAELDALARTPIGTRLLASLADSGQTVTIVPSRRLNQAPPVNYRGAFAAGSVLRWISRAGKERAILGDGGGSGTKIRFNPSVTRFGAA